jgi:hypothetical protein
MSGERAEGLEVLREVWRSQGQDTADLDDGCEAKSCKRMADAGVGFDGFADEEPGNVVDLAGAWRSRLRREGKYNAGGGTLRDLVMGRSASLGETPPLQPPAKITNSD